MFPILLTELAKYVHGTIYGDSNITITGISSINNAKEGDITFLSKNNLKDKLSSCQASVIITTQNNLVFCKKSALIVHDPYLTYAKIVQLINRNTPEPIKKISKNAIIEKKVTFGKRIGIGDNAIIEKGVILGDDVTIGPGSIIRKNTKIGNGTQLLANVTIYHDIQIGKYCLIQSGTIIGSDGFGYINNSNKWTKIPHLGSVCIGDYVEIGACTTIDRGSLDETKINDGVIIDNQCHIAHNVVIGENTAIAGGVIIAGSTIIGKHCMIGGASVINGHIEICDHVTITGMSMVMRKITKPGTYSSGIPAQKNNIWRKTAALIMNISNINKRIKILEKNFIKNAP